MGGKSPPPVPDPTKVAAAQTFSNAQTAIANAYMSNTDTYGPLGNTNYSIQGYRDIEVEKKNGKYKTIKVPIFKQVNRLSDDQQALLDVQEDAGLNLGQLAVQQSDYLKDYLKGGIDPNQLPAQVMNAPNAPAEYSVAQHLRPEYRERISADPIQHRVDLTNQALEFDDAGHIQRQIGADDFSADRRRVEQALMSRIDPQIERDRAALEARLANQGISLGSEAYSRAMDQQGRDINDLRMQAVLAGGQEQSRLFGMDQAQGQFANQAQAQRYDQELGRGNFRNAAIAANNQSRLAEGQFFNQAQAQDFQQEATADQFYNQVQQQMATDDLRRSEHINQVKQQDFDARNVEAQMQQTLRQQSLQEQLALRNQPLSEMAQLLHGSAPTIPQFQGWNAPTMANTPVGQYHYQSAQLAQQNYMAQLQSQNGLFGGLGSLFGGLFSLSDRRAKENITRIGQADNGLPLYLYNYIGETERRIGPMADEVEQVKPWAVREVGGLKAVRYDLAMEA